MEIREFLTQQEAIVDIESIKEILKNKTILVTGGAGYIGSALCRYLFNFDVKKVIAFDIDDTRLHELWLEMDENKHFVSFLGNIRDIESLNEVFTTYDIDIVFHAGALKHVPLLELYPKEAVKTNINGTKNLIRIAIGKKVKYFINISTDKAADRSCILGRTKYVGETLCAYFGTRSQTKVLSVRFGNIYNSRGSVVPIFENQIKKNKMINITGKNMERYFILIEDAMNLTLQSMLLHESNNDIFTFDMGYPIKILDLANYLIDKSNQIVGINYIGNRPGDSLTEHLNGKKEQLEKTNHKKIMRIKKI